MVGGSDVPGIGCGSAVCGDGGGGRRRVLAEPTLWPDFARGLVQLLKTGGAVDGTVESRGSWRCSGDNRGFSGQAAQVMAVASTILAAPRGTCRSRRRLMASPNAIASARSTRHVVCSGPCPTPEPVISTAMSVHFPTFTCRFGLTARVICPGGVAVDSKSSEIECRLIW